MTTEKEEILQELNKAGLKAEPTESVPFFRNPVQCGMPTEIGDEDVEMIEIPASLVRRNATFMSKNRDFLTFL
ncbi:MAG: hypothetical protein KBS94_03740 [Prevotella sp.]|nr:hypothetical protein [Candidatus Equicola faecalis]